MEASAEKILADAEKLEMERAFRQLMLSAQPREYAAAFSAQHGFSGAVKCRVTLLRTGGSDEELARRRDCAQSIADEELRRSCMALMLPGGLAVVSVDAENDTMTRFAKRLSEELLPAGDGKSGVGLSQPAEGPEMLSRCYRQALAAACDAAFRKTGFRFYSELGVYQLLYAVEDRQVLRGYVDGVLGPIEAFDESRRTDYGQVLRKYIESGGSVQKTAEALGVHRNTVNYKIRGIRERFGLHMSGDDILRLSMAYCCRALLENGYPAE